MWYQFKCPECEGLTEIEAPMEEGPGEQYCLPCTLFRLTGGIVWMKRVWHASAVIFRGGGWASKS